MTPSRGQAGCGAHNQRHERTRSDHAAGQPALAYARPDARPGPAVCGAAAAAAAAGCALGGPQCRSGADTGAGGLAGPPGRPAPARRQRPARGRHAGQRLFRPPVWRLGRPTGRRPCALAGRVGYPCGSHGVAAQGRRPDALLPHGRRAGRAAIVHPRVPVFRGHARPGHPDDARAGHRRLAAAGAARDAGDGRCRHTRGAQLPALRPL